MSRKIEDPADTPAEAYHYWHERWCQILTEEHRDEIVKAGLPGLSFTEHVPDAPDGKGYFSYAFDELGRLDFMDGQGRAVAEYDSYELGLRLLSDESMDAPQALADGRFRILSQPEDWAALTAVMPLLRATCQRAIEEAETRFDLELPKYW
ncbi:MAG: hypothetical protein JRG80_21145 [Deltaproteobacteria bacterium]|nr:hypothetical protein [Deltaproteobacteria bacterium]MBW2401726.1 hypothetical protein [Deltaproteobacteria bacterium]